MPRKNKTSKRKIDKVFRISIERIANLETDPIETRRMEVYVEFTSESGEDFNYSRASYPYPEWAEAAYARQIDNLKAKGYRQESFIVEHHELHGDYDPDLMFTL